jgi:formylglycine-generating enzyme required for sulfatase activity
MITIPGGTYFMGTDDIVFSSSGTSDMLPDSIYRPHKVIIEEFKISKYEIETSLFLQFLKESGRNSFDVEDIYSKLLEYNSEQFFNYPAVSNYFYALDFCKWLSAKSGKQYRLPTEAEWEYAATGGDGRKYPWGNTYQTIGKNGDTQRLPLKKYSKDKSPFGIMNMYGNVAEWVLDYFQYNAYSLSKMVNPICIDGEQVSSDKDYIYPPTYVVRGTNSYFYNFKMIEIPVDEFANIKRRYPYWHDLFSRTPNENIGFRIVEEIKNTKFSINIGEVIYHYQIYTTLNSTNIFLSPAENAKILVRVNKNEKLRGLFLLVDDNDAQWVRVQTVNYTEYTEGKKMGDEGIVGWIKMKYLKE